MKDPVFAGKDVAEAVRVASRTLAVPESALRYVVLDPGQPGGRGLSPTEARIAVLIERLVAAGRAETPAPGADAEVDWDAGRGRRRPRREEAPRPEHEAPPAEADPAAVVRAVVHEIARAAGVDLAVDVSDGREGVELRLEGPGAHLFFDPQGEALAALEHLFDRLYGRALAGRRLRLRCAGYREYRDELLREQALELAREVCADGQARTTAPLNAYERRVIHVTLEGHGDVTTFSVGEGHGRRVTVALQDRADARPSPAPSAAEQPEPSAVNQPAASPAPAPQQDASASRPAEPQPAATPITPTAFDPKQFDRPPQGGGASELM